MGVGIGPGPGGGGGTQFDWKAGVRLATAAAMAASTRTGNVRVADANGAMAVIDGVAPAVGDAILDKNHATGADRGIWVVDALGADDPGGSKWQMTRRFDASADGDVTAGMAVRVAEGATYADRVFVLTTDDPIIVNTTALTFALASGDVYGAGASTDNALARWNGTTGTALEDSVVLSSDAGDVKMPAAAYLRLGLAPGSGAGSAASVGGLRLQGDGAVAGQIVLRNADDDGDVGGMACNAADALFIGGPYPTRPATTHLDAVGAVYCRTAGVMRIEISGTKIQQTPPLFEFHEGAANPLVAQGADATASVICDTLTMRAQGASNATGGASAGTSGSLVVGGGDGMVHADNKTGNVAVHVAPSSWNTGERIAFIGDAETAPTGNPVAGGYLYSVVGAGTWRGSGGTVTAFGPAGPRCGACGHDFWKQAQVNERLGSHLLECGWCGKIYRKGPADVRGLLEPRELDELVYDDDDPSDPRPLHKRRSIAAMIVGPATRRKDFVPTTQEYRAQHHSAITGTPPVRSAGGVVDQAATRAAAKLRIAALRAKWIAPLKSWRALYQALDDGETLIEALEADVREVETSSDTALAAHEWEAA